MTSGTPASAREEYERRWFGGGEIYGEHLSLDDQRRWVRDEEQAYSDLASDKRERSGSEYYALNWYHGWRHLPGGSLGTVLGFGSAEGSELLPLLSRVADITIVEPGSTFRNRAIGDRLPRYVHPPLPGEPLPFPDRSFDLVVALSVLHHLPHVGETIAELARVSRRWIVMREPIVSMGDWRESRKGMTAHERGIPLRPFIERVERAGIAISHMSVFGSPIARGIARGLHRSPYNSRIVTRIDSAAARLLLPAYTYHPIGKRSVRRLGPTGVALVGVRQADGQV